MIRSQRVYRRKKARKYKKRIKNIKTGKI